MRAGLALFLIPFIVVGSLQINDHLVCKEAKEQNRPAPAFCKKK